MKVAVIGAGTMGAVHTTALIGLPDVSLVGLVDPRPGAAALATRLQTPLFATWDDLLAAQRPDLVDICAPTDQHRRCVELAAAAGAHVICEKPLARTLGDARAMLQACAAAGVQLYVGHVVRFFPEYVRARELVLSGAVGRPGVIRTTRAGPFPATPDNWYADYTRSGGPLLDLLIHDYDWLRWTFGEVERVFARSIGGGALLDYALVTLRFTSGAMAHLEGSWAHREPFHTRLEIAGSEGIIEHDSRLSAPLRLHADAASVRSDGLARAVVPSGGGVAVPESPLAQSPYATELAHFIDCLRRGATPRVTADDAYAALEIALAAIASAATGQPARPGA